MQTFVLCLLLNKLFAVFVIDNFDNTLVLYAFIILLQHCFLVGLQQLVCPDFFVTLIIFNVSHPKPINIYLFLGVAIV